MRGGGAGRAEPAEGRGARPAAAPGPEQVGRWWGPMGGDRGESPPVGPRAGSGEQGEAAARCREAPAFLPRCFVGGRPLFAPPPPVPKLRSPVLLGGRRAGSRLWSAVRDRPLSPFFFFFFPPSGRDGRRKCEIARGGGGGGGEPAGLRPAPPARSIASSQVWPRGDGGKGSVGQEPPPGVCRSLPSCAALYLRVFIPVFFPDRVGGGVMGLSACRWG